MAEYMKPEVDMENMNYKPMDNCIPQETTIKNVRLAAAYVPFEKFCTIFSPIEALKAGTVFPELYSPYDGKKMSKMSRYELF